MLNYSNTHRRDPNVKKHALKCALTLAAIVALGFILFNYGGAIWYGISTTIEVVYSVVAGGFVATAQFLKPVFSAVGQYMLWACLLVCLWSLCVYCKIDPNCKESIFQWRIIGLGATSFFFLYTLLYMIYLNLNEDPFSEYGRIYAFLWVFMLMFIACFTLDNSDQDKPQ